MPAPRLDRVMAEIEALGYGTEEYHEALWMLLSVMARRQAVLAESARRSRLAMEARARRRADREAARG